MAMENTEQHASTSEKNASGEELSAAEEGNCETISAQENVSMSHSHGIKSLQPRRLISNSVRMALDSTLDLLAETSDSIFSTPTSRSQSGSSLFDAPAIARISEGPRSTSIPLSPKIYPAPEPSKIPIVEVSSPMKKRESLIERAAKKFRNV
jgi:hypothetical protein